MPIDLDSLSTLDYRRIQALAKEYGVKANQKKPDIIRELSEVAAKSGHWQLCSQLRIELIRVHGFSAYLAPLPENGHSRNWRSHDAQQIWETLKLGTPLCFLFNQLPDVPGIDIVEMTTAPSGDQNHRAASDAFIKALSDMERSGRWTGGTFTLPDLYHDEDNALDPQKVIKVVTVVIRLVNLIPCPTSGRHIHDLPVELISNIFGIATITDLLDPPFPPRNILLVCRRWRDISVQSGCLWTKIYINDQLQGRRGKPTKQVDKISLFLRMSKDKDLTLVFRQHQRDVQGTQPGLLEYLGDSAQRVRNFAVTFNSLSYSGTYINQQVRLVESMPRLDTLLLRRHRSTGGVHSNIHSTSLRDLDVLNMSFDWPTCGFPNLVVLKLKEEWSWSTWHLQRFATALALMPHLRHLTIIKTRNNYSYFPPENVSADLPRVAAPNLRELELGGPSYLLNGFLRLLEAPQLRQARVTGFSRRDPLIPMSWSGCIEPFPELETLALWFVPSPRRLLAKLVPKREIPVDVVIVGDADSEFFDSLEGTVCKGSGEDWDCMHEECRALAEKYGVTSAMTRFNVHYAGGQDPQQPEIPPEHAQDGVEPQDVFAAYLATLQ